MFQSTKVMNGSRDDVRSRSVTETMNDVDNSYAGLSLERQSLTRDSEIPMEAIGVDQRTTHNYVFCATEKKYFYITLAIVVLTLLFYLSKQGIALYLSALLTWVKSLGIWGNVIFVLLFVLISFPVILAGYIPLTLGAGAIYGVIVGTVTVSIASTVGACIAFWFCRVAARGWVEPWLKDSNEFRFFFYMFQSGQYKMVSVLARLAPIPFGLQNSFFAMTDISFKEYFLSTWIGLLPFQVVWTHLGTTLRNVQKIGTGEFELDFWQQMSIMIQVVVAVLLIIYFVVLSRKIKEIAAQNPVLFNPAGNNSSTTSDGNNNMMSVNSLRRNGDIEMGRL